VFNLQWLTVSENKVVTLGVLLISFLFLSHLPKTHKGAIITDTFLTSEIKGSFDASLQDTYSNLVKVDPSRSNYYREKCEFDVGASTCAHCALLTMDI
jgi:hypothetical protein